MSVPRSLSQVRGMPPRSRLSANDRCAISGRRHIAPCRSRSEGGWCRRRPGVRYRRANERTPCAAARRSASSGQEMSRSSGHVFYDRLRMVVLDAGLRRLRADDLPPVLRGQDGCTVDSVPAVLPDALGWRCRRPRRTWPKSIGRPRPQRGLVGDKGHHSRAMKAASPSDKPCRSPAVRAPSGQSPKFPINQGDPAKIECP
jgi:hypothetical protein